MVTDQGLAWADGTFDPFDPSFVVLNPETGEMHRRYKKILLPAFGIPEAKEFLPVFTHVVTRVSDVPHFSSSSV
jgi:hypothetical protein